MKTNKPAKFTIPEMLKYSFEHFWNRPALSIVGEKPITYAEFQTAVKSLSQELILRDIKKGDKVAILGENSPNWVISYYSIVSIGAVAVPILTGFPDSMTRHILRHSGAVAAFVQDKHLNKVENFEESSLKWIFTLEDLSASEYDANSSLLISKKPKKKIFDIKKNIDQRALEPNEEDLAVIIYTSGTTGHSKGVMLTQKNIAIDVYSTLEVFKIEEDDKAVSILPLAHAYEAAGTLAFLYRGASIVYLQGLPTPQNLLKAMQTEKPTGCLSVPLVMDKIYRKRILNEIQASSITWTLYQFPLTRKLIHRKAGKKLIEAFGGNFRFFIFGGAAISEDVEVFMKEAKIPYTTGYGMTETAPILTFNPFESVKYGSCGKAISCVDLKIYQPNSLTGIGEVIVRGPNVMQGYYQNPEATNEIFLDGGWLKTGDLGYLDKDGYLFLKGRSKNVIIGPSGENIYPEMIEQMILHYPQIQETIVYDDDGKLVAFAFPDYDFIDKLMKDKHETNVSMEERTQVILEELRKEINAHLPNFSQLSKIIERTEPFEMTPTKKIKRYLYVKQNI